jgi:hypothetical protein
MAGERIMEDETPTQPVNSFVEADVRTSIDLADLPATFWWSIVLVLVALAVAVVWRLVYPSEIAVIVVGSAGGYWFQKGLTTAINKKRQQLPKP